ncbi:hypothetical protein [Bradyrhizobium tropiciagri]|uniref:hypothetical protein n=1 Tax=Bradyrhizobium tropiciagri TaxID=312253 RepID=UPI00067DE541|nr:hypothetical protein [Bradyrhizobium tropiciagri]
MAGDSGETTLAHIQPLAQFLAAFPANLAFRVFIVQIVRFGEVASCGDTHLTEQPRHLHRAGHRGT